MEQVKEQTANFEKNNHFLKDEIQERADSIVKRWQKFSTWHSLHSPGPCSCWIFSTLAWYNCIVYEKKDIYSLACFSCNFGTLLWILRDHNKTITLLRHSLKCRESATAHNRVFYVRHFLSLVRGYISGLNLAGKLLSAPVASLSPSRTACIQLTVVVLLASSFTSSHQCSCMRLLSLLWHTRIKLHRLVSACSWKLSAGAACSQLNGVGKFA